MIQENVSKSSSQILNEPNSLNVENGISADLALTGARPNESVDAANTIGLVTNAASPDVVAKVSTLEPLQPSGSQLPISTVPALSDTAQTHQQSQVQNNPAIPNSNPIISSNFDKPNFPKRNQKNQNLPQEKPMIPPQSNPIQSPLSVPSQMSTKTNQNYPLIHLHYPQQSLTPM